MKQIELPRAGMRRVPGTLARMLGAAAALALMAGCQTAGYAPRAEPRGFLVGFVSHAVPDPVVVVALERATNRVAHRAFLGKFRRYQLPLPAGSYKVYAFADSDRDGAPGPEELVSVTYIVTNPVAAGVMLELPALTLSQTFASAR